MLYTNSRVSVASKHKANIFMFVESKLSTLTRIISVSIVTGVYRENRNACFAFSRRVKLCFDNIIIFSDVNISLLSDHDIDHSAIQCLCERNSMFV